MTRRLAAGAALAALCALASAPLGAQTAEPRPALARINSLVIDRDYSGAAALIRGELAASPEASLQLRLARVLLLGGQPREAIAACEPLMAQPEDNPLAIRATFTAAGAHAALGEFGEARALIHGRVAHLLSPERKSELAQIYIDHARRLLDPEEESEPPNHEQARFHLQQALELGLPGALAHAVRHTVGQTWVSQENWTEAANLYRPLEEETRGTGLHAAVLRELGRAELRLGNLAEARHRLRSLMREHPASPQAAEAERLLPETFGGVNPPTGPMMLLAVQAYRDFASRHPASPEAQQALLDAARALRARGRTAEAVEAARAFLAAHGQSEHAPEARILLGELHAGAEQFAEARTAWQEFLREHPTSARWTEIQRRLLDLDFTEAETLMADEEWGAAAQRLRTFLDAYPLDARQPDALFLLGEIEERQERWEQAIAAWRDLADKFPSTAAAQRGLVRSAEIAIEELGDVARARELYRRASQQGDAGAQQTLALMENPELTIETERAFAAGERPRLRLCTRNIETIACAAHRIDLETYFRAKHTLAGVAGLDIALIDPTETWTHRVAGYEPFALHEEQLELPLDGPGAWVIRLSTDEWEATSLVLVTDLAVIAKASRNQALIFAVDTAGETPARGVRVLLSDGAEVFAELTTGDDGCVVYEDASALRDLASLRVLVTDGESVAASELDLGAVTHIEGRQPRGFLWSAKPVYQPGQTAQIAGVIRVVENGRYTYAAGERWRVTVADSRGQTLLSEVTPLDDFGTLHLACEIPGTTPVGTCTVTATPASPGAPGETPLTFTGAFLVDRYQIDQTQITVALDRRVVVRGEPITATVTLRRYTGEPVRQASVEYQLPGDIRHTGTTGSTGELRIELPTGELASEGPQPLEVTFREENLTVREEVVLAETSVTAEVSTVRPVYLAGEPFGVAVRTEDVTGQPVGVPATLTVVRVTASGEQTVTEQPLTTDAATGDGAVQLAVAEGGLHRLRVEGVDAEGRPFSAQATVTISDEEDEIRLRLLADQDHWRAGDTASLTVVNRTAGRLALATWEADRTLRHEVLRLAAGRSTWSFPLSTDDSPNVVVALAVVASGELHSAEHELEVANDMRVTLSPEVDVVEPGATASVRVEARDPGGRPVEARLALALVDEALLARYPDATPDIADFFFGAVRQHTVRTGSSAGFTYGGVTRPISGALIAEAQWRAREEQLAQHSFGQNMAWAAAPAASPLPAALATPSETFDRLAMSGAPVTGGTPGYYGEEVSSIEGVAARRAGVASTASESIPAPAVRRDFAELAFFDPAVTTAGDGAATVSLSLPDNTTRWRLIARGTTRDTLVGQGEGAVTTRRDFYVSLQAPPRLTEGDRVAVPVRVHNLTAEARSAELVVRALHGSTEIVAPVRQTLAVGAEGRAETVIEFPVEAPRDVTLLVSASAGALHDALEQTIAVDPWGVEVTSSRGGVVSADHTVTLGLASPEGMLRPRLAIDIFPHWEDALLEPLARRSTAGPSEAASRALIDIALLDQLGAANPVEARRAARRQSLQGAVAQLLGSQQASGGWSWMSETGATDLAATAQALRALAGARRHGIAVDPAAMDRAANQLIAMQAGLPTADLAARAEIQSALAAANRADPTLLAALHRERARLDVRSLALVTLAFHQMGRPEIAAELAAILAQSFTPQDDPIIICWEMREPVIGGSQDNLEATALAVLALETVEGLTAQVEGGARFLMDRLPQPGVFSDRAAAATAMALGRYHAQTQPAAARLEIDVLLDGRVIDTVQWLGAPEAVSIALGEGEFDPAAVRLDFRPRGEGSFAYRAVISAFEPGVAASDQGGQGVWLNREYLQPERRHGGRTVPRGASVVVDARNVPSNPATAVERGGEVIVNVHFWRHADVMANAHLVVEEPLPAGTQLVDGSLSGNFVHSETLPGLLRLHWPLDSGWSGSFSYRLRGVVPGQFRVLPTAVRNVYNSDQTVRAQPAALATLRDGQPNPDPYTLTPDELYHLGLWQAEAGDHAAALGHLTELFDRWRLNQTADRAVTSQLLASALETGDAATAIRFFEVIRERHADIVLTWDQTLQVAQAYAAREEHEQAWQVLRGAAEASFLRDAQVAGVLEAQGAHRASIAHMDSLIATYPDLETVQSALFALAGAIELKANDAALRETLAEDGLTEAELHEMSLRRLEQFLADHPENPRAPDATLSLATLWVQLERRAPAIELCQALRRRYPESPLVDDALYLEAYARFQEGQDDEAAALCEQIAAGDFPTPEGPRAPSENTPQAQYILAQIRHAQGDAAGAVAAYRVIEQRFPDAAEAIAHFTRRALSLPEVTTHATEGAPTVTLTTCNLDEVHLRVFRVDLLTLVLLRRNLDQIVDVDLAGIRPTFDQAVNIGGADDFRAHETDVDLGLEEPGAYLVVAAADNEMASGLVLLSDLDLEVQEDPASGRVRVNLLGGDGQPLADADVRVIGTGNATFESGRTDRRGIFIADRISGAATVLVRSGEQFAFHRGETALGGAAWPQTPSPMAVEADADVLLGRALGNNMGTLRSQQSMLHDITVNTQRGVDVYRVRQ